MDRCQPRSRGRRAAQQSLPVSPAGTRLFLLLPEKGPAPGLGRCHWPPSMEGEAL